MQLTPLRGATKLHIVNATGLKTALWRCDLGADLPLLAVNCHCLSDQVPAYTDEAPHLIERLFVAAYIPPPPQGLVKLRFLHYEHEGAFDGVGLSFGTEHDPRTRSAYATAG